MRIAIVGCGVAGSVMAGLLADVPGLDVQCFEKASPGEHAEAGTGLNVGPNAIKALRLASPSLHATLLGSSYPWTRWNASRADGTPIFDFALRELADDDGIRIRWSELYRLLRAPLDGLVHYGAEVLDSRVDGDALALRWRDADGAERDAGAFDLVVAGDGRYSALRSRFGGPWTPRHLGVVLYRLLVEDDSSGLMGDYRWWFNGPNRLLAFRVPEDRVYIAGSFPIAPGAEIPAERKSPDAFARTYFPAHRAPCDEVRWMVGKLSAQAAQIHWARLQESPPLFRDPSGRVLFVGDSAHGMVPTLGQGATQAIEDACTAAALVRRHLHVHGAAAAAQVPELTAAISQARQSRVRWVMDFSWDATAAMLEGADGAQEMLALRTPPRQDDFRRLWAQPSPVA